MPSCSSPIPAPRRAAQRAPGSGDSCPRNRGDSSTEIKCWGRLDQKSIAFHPSTPKSPADVQLKERVQLISTEVAPKVHATQDASASSAYWNWGPHSPAALL